MKSIRILGRISALVLSCVFSAGSASAICNADGTKCEKIPPAKQVKSCTMDLTQSAPSALGMIKNLGNGETLKSYVPLLDAVRYSKPGDVICLDPGVYKGGTLGVYKPNNKNSYAWMKNNQPIDLVIQSKDPRNRAQINGLAVDGRVDELGGGGVLDLTLKDLVLASGGWSGFHVNMGSRHDKLRIYRSHFTGKNNPESWQGYGQKWGMRGHGLVDAYDYRDNTFDRALEHAIYIDSPGWRNGINSHSYFIRQVQLAPTPRTGFQSVSRPNAGASAGGTLVILGGFFWTEPSAIASSGGSAITFAGGLMDTYVHNVSVTTTMGCLVAWTDDAANKGGAYVNENGYSMNYLSLKKFKCNAWTKFNSQSRHHIMIAGVERVDIAGASVASTSAVQGDRIALELDGPLQGPIPNGQVNFFANGPISQDGFFQSKQGKIRQWNNNQSVPNVLTDFEIDEEFMPYSK